MAPGIAVLARRIRMTVPASVRLGEGALPKLLDGILHGLVCVANQLAVLTKDRKVELVATGAKTVIPEGR
jgi:hypothetical protein